MSNPNIESKKRTDLMCLSIKSVYEKLKYLAGCTGLSFSGYLKFLITREYNKERRKCNLADEHK